ncbi:serine/threonine-protein kinase ATM-like [Quercus lobata]|uniref:serine/threonine-protein kinase ATM-like n=1 Tax=Quercus lobata TaxID=97700 RepID=UPI001247BF86|nr:serine/threonine-protein kinase ATM-like [Quercus lobata]
MMCAVIAIDPCQRELVNAVLHNLSRQLKYASMLKYLEELMGSILFCWVACRVSLVALVGVACHCWLFWSKITLCQSLLSVWHCIAVRNLGGKRQQLFFRVQFCVLLRYLGVNETNS